MLSPYARRELRCGGKSLILLFSLSRDEVLLRVNSFQFEIYGAICVEKMSRGNFSVWKIERQVLLRLLDFCTFRFISICCSGVVIIFWLKNVIKVPFVNCIKLHWIVRIIYNTRNVQIIHLVLLKFPYVKESFSNCASKYLSNFNQLVINCSRLFLILFFWYQKS